MIIGIDASRNRSGGAIAYLMGLFSAVELTMFSIDEIHIWAYKSLLDKIPDHPWLIKHTPPLLEKSLLHQVFWQAFDLSKELKKWRCDILFTTEASTLCSFLPSVVLSQNLLPYEPSAVKLFAWGKARFRLIFLRYIQNAAFRRASGVVFLTQYAAETIQAMCHISGQITVIPHGIGHAFVSSGSNAQSLQKKHIRCVYVSPISRYKYQWVVAHAISDLRKKGYDIAVDFIGSDDGTAQPLVDTTLSQLDPYNQFIKKKGAVAHADLPTRLTEYDIFIFASGCENMPITLLEAMSVGLPIASSDRGPMKEVLEDGGVYFNPENAESIAKAVETLILDDDLRRTVVARAETLVRQYSWKRCAKETFSFIETVYNDLNILPKFKH